MLYDWPQDNFFTGNIECCVQFSFLRNMFFNLIPYKIYSRIFCWFTKYYFLHIMKLNGVHTYIHGEMRIVILRFHPYISYGQSTFSIVSRHVKGGIENYRSYSKILRIDKIVILYWINYEVRKRNVKVYLIFWKSNTNN